MTKHGNHIHLEVGAQLDGNWIKTPAELSEALDRLDHGRIEFWPTDPYTRGLGQHFKANSSDLQHKHVHLTVVGPHPWLDRSWHRKLESEWDWNTRSWKLVVSA